MLQEREQVELSQDVISRVERDLKCYPDWIVRLEVRGLGITSKATLAGGSGSNVSSLVELDAELSDETKRKVIAIEKVYDMLHGRTKDFVDYRYFQGYNRDKVREMLAKPGNSAISKKTFYAYRDRALKRFARAFGYIE